MRITSPDSPIVRRLRRLADSARASRDAGRTLVEGLHVIEAALAAKVEFVTLATRGTPSPVVAAVIERAQAAAAGRGMKCIELGATLYDAIAPVEHGVGVLAEIAIPVQGEAPASGRD